MTNPVTLDIIRSEHRRLATIITCFVGVLNDIKDREKPSDMGLLSQIVAYLEEFLYRYHHPKEDDYLFRRLKERDAKSAALISRLSDEHNEGRTILHRLRANLKRYLEDNSRERFLAFYNIAMVYRDFEYHHMGTEERELLPLALAHFTDADWRELDAIFSEHDDPVFGERADAKFRDLAANIIHRAPAPHGLGVAG